jgi:hypothetical protein
VEVRYKADITAGALKLPESRLIADLLLRKVGAEGWKDIIVTKNVLQARSPATARRLTKLIRGRLETMGPDLWKLVRDGKGTVATHAVFAAAVKHSPLLGDFLELVVGEQYRVFGTALTNTMFADCSLDGSSCSITTNSFSNSTGIWTTGERTIRNVRFCLP